MTIGVSQNTSGNIDSLVNEAVKAFLSDNSHVGLSVSFFYNGKQYFYAYGLADKDKNTPVTRKTVFEIGSITKTFAGLILAKAVEDNKVHLDDDIRIYLKESYPNLEYKGSPIKLYHLLNHSSGLPFDYIDRSKFAKANADSLPLLVGNLEHSYTKQQLYKDLYSTKIDTIPGIKLSYSNVAAQLLSYILEEVYDKTYEDLLNQLILKPAKMKTTGFYETLRKAPIAKGYNKSGVLMPYNQSKAAGGLLSNSEDLLNYGILQLDEGKKIVALSYQPTWGQIEYYAMGLNWQMQKKDNYRRIWQSGGTAGFTSLLSVYPEKQTCFVLLANESDENSQGELSKIEGKLFESLDK
jgi:serine-type D-Ala-D-Ala carboxypeptidase/endopeptidase